MNKALKDLISIGKKSKDVEVYGKTWSMHTLDTQDQLSATNSTSDYDNLSRVMALKVTILSRAIDTVDGEPLGNAGEARELLSRLQVPLINKLYDEYDKLVTAQNDELNKLELEDTKTAKEEKTKPE